MNPVFVGERTSEGPDFLHARNRQVHPRRPLVETAAHGRVIPAGKDFDESDGRKRNRIYYERSAYRAPLSGTDRFARLNPAPAGKQ